MKKLIIVLLFLPITVQAQDWQPVDDPEVLRDLMSDRVMTATLKGDQKAVARYFSDGSGELEAWGETFRRSWEIKGNDQVCIAQGNTVTCYRFERNPDDNNQIRVENSATGEKLVVIVTRQDVTTVESETPNTDSGGPGKPSAEEIAAALANPNTPMASMTTKLQYRTFEGDLPNADDQSSTTLLFQPALPFVAGKGQVFFRPALPIVFDQPNFNIATSDFDEDTGFGDLAFDLAYGETTESGVLWAAGIISSLPIGSDDLSSDLYTLGPEFLIGKITPNWVIGAFPNHQWDIGGSGDGDVNLTTIQLFGTLIPGGGYTWGTAPIITYDHNSEEWTIPINFNIGKTVIQSNGRPWKLSAEINYYVDQPEPFGPEWMIGISIAPVIANPLAKWFQ